MLGRADNGRKRGTTPGAQGYEFQEPELNSTFPEDLVKISEIGLALAYVNRLFKEAKLCICDAAVHSAILRPVHQLFGSDTPGFESCLISGIVLFLNPRRNRLKNLSHGREQALDGSHECFGGKAFGLAYDVALDEAEHRAQYECQTGQIKC